MKPFLLHLIFHIIRSFFFSLPIPILIFFGGGREGPLLRAPVKRFRNLKIKNLQLKGFSQIQESLNPNGLPKSVISGYSKTQNLPKIVSIAALITITSGNTHLGYNLNCGFFFALTHQGKSNFQNVSQILHQVIFWLQFTCQT